MKKSILPESAWIGLHGYGITSEDIIEICQMDLSLAGDYADGFLFLTKKYLGTVMSTSKSDRVRYFRGTKMKEVDNYEDESDFTYQVFDVNEIDSVSLERMVGTNCIVIQYQGELRKIGALTNLHIEQMNHLTRNFESLKHPLGYVEPVLEEKNENGEPAYCPVCGTMYPDPKRKICPKCMNKKTIFARTARYFLKYKFKVIILFLSYILTALMSLVFPYLSGTILFDKVLKQNEDFLSRFGLSGEYMLALLILVMVIVVTNVLTHLVDIINRILTAQIVADTVRDIKKDVFSSMGRLSIHFFTSKQTGSLMTRVLSDAERVTDFFLDGFPYIFIHGFTIIASFVVMFRLNAALALLACILLPLLVIMSVKLRPKLWGLYGRRHRAERSVNSRLNDNLTGARVVKAFGQQQPENERFDGTNERLKDAEIKIVKYNTRFSILYSVVQEISSIWVWVLGVILLMKTDQLPLGVLITFVSYVDQLNGPMRFFSHVFRMWSDSMNSAQRIFEIMDAVPEVQEQSNAIQLTNPKGIIDLDHVTFGYDSNRPVLKDICLHVNEGEMIGIVGRSGAGKTTLVNLISRLYDVNDGTISIDGTNVRSLAFKDLRRNVAMVSQDTYIFMGTVADNIAYANPNASRDAIVEAAILASAHEFISNMPDGYDTVIGASGKELSGGEKQRISIARAVLADPKILILDEATASVDTATEKAIQKSLGYLVKGRTTLSIAHRLSTLRDADRLIVIDDGKIVEEGTHTQLEALHGTYYKLLELQTKSLALKGLED